MWDEQILPAQHGALSDPFTRRTAVLQPHLEGWNKVSSTAHMHPLDRAELGIAAGDGVTIHSRHGTIPAVVDRRPQVAEHCLQQRALPFGGIVTRIDQRACVARR